MHPTGEINLCRWVEVVHFRWLVVGTDFTEMCSGSEAGWYLRLIDLCLSLNSRLESNKEGEEGEACASHTLSGKNASVCFRAPISTFGLRVSGCGFRVASFGFRVSGFGLRVSFFVWQVSGFGFRVASFGFRVSGFGTQTERRTPARRRGVRGQAPPPSPSGPCFRFGAQSFGSRVRVLGLGSRV